MKNREQCKENHLLLTALELAIEQKMFNKETADDLRKISLSPNVAIAWYPVPDTYFVSIYNFFAIREVLMVVIICINEQNGQFSCKNVTYFEIVISQMLDSSI